MDELFVMYGKPLITHSPRNAHAATADAILGFCHAVFAQLPT